MNGCSKQDANVKYLMTLANQIKGLFEISLRKLPYVNSTCDCIEATSNNPRWKLELGHIRMITVDDAKVKQRCCSTYSEYDEIESSDSSAAAGCIFFIIQGKELRSTRDGYDVHEDVSHLEQRLAWKWVVYWWVWASHDKKAYATIVECTKLILTFFALVSVKMVNGWSSETKSNRREMHEERPSWHIVENQSRLQYVFHFVIWVLLSKNINFVINIVVKLRQIWNSTL